MNRALALMVVFMLSGQTVVLANASENLSTLTDAGQTDELDRPLVLWSVLNTGQVLTVDNQGNISVNAVSNGILSTQWTVFLNVDANKARVDQAQELVTVAHQTGAYVVQLSSQTVLRNISTTDPVNSRSAVL